MLIIRQLRVDRSGQESLQSLHQAHNFTNSSTAPNSHSTFHPWNILSVCVINSNLDNNLASKTSAAAMSPNQQQTETISAHEKAMNRDDKRSTALMTVYLGCQCG